MNDEGAGFLFGLVVATAVALLVCLTVSSCQFDNGVVAASNGTYTAKWEPQRPGQRTGHWLVLESGRAVERADH